MSGFNPQFDDDEEKEKVRCPNCGHRFSEDDQPDPQVVERSQIKALARKLDPECWESYSGKPKHVKQFVERRRQEALSKAERLYQQHGSDALLMHELDNAQKK